jgi:hypothetical protein
MGRILAIQLVRIFLAVLVMLSSAGCGVLPPQSAEQLIQSAARNGTKSLHLGPVFCESVPIPIIGDCNLIQLKYAPVHHLPPEIGQLTQLATLEIVGDLEMLGAFKKISIQESRHFINFDIWIGP